MATCEGLAKVASDDDLVPPDVAVAAYRDLWHSLENGPQEEWEAAFEKIDQALTDAAYDSRQSAAEAVLTALLARLEDRDRQVRMAAVAAMGRACSPILFIQQC